MKTKSSYSNEFCFNPGSWATLLLALGFIASAGLYLFLAFKQPTDGQVYETRLDGQLIVVGSPLGDSGPLVPGDKLLAIEGKPATTTDIQFIARPPGWQIGGVAQYLVQRGDVKLELEVPLVARSLSTIFRIYDLNGTFFPASLLFCLIGFIVFFLRPRETAARLLMLFSVYWNTMDLIVSADTAPTFYYYPTGLFWMNVILNSLWPLMFAMILHFILVFPLQKWPLTRWPRLSIPVIYGVPATAIALALSINQIYIYVVVLGVTILSVILAMITATAHNLRHIHDPVTRAQIGWVVLGISTQVAAVPIVFGLQSLLPNLDVTITEIPAIFHMLLPLCIGIAITRYRLFDIDIIIRRTLQYTLITGLLALVYFGGVALLQSIFGVITSQADSPLVTVISTLVIAALFNPLRLRTQNFIDRHFYRKKYDAQRALAQFAVTARGEVETGRLTSSLLGIVQEAMQPEQVTLWLAQGQPAGATSRRSEKESQHLASNGARNDSRTLAGYNIDN
jgi:hypothetical protein